MFSSSICLHANNKIAFFFLDEWNSIVCECHIFIIYSPLVGYVHWFHNLAILKNAAINIGVPISLLELDFL
jgi:hypothetical protein